MTQLLYSQLMIQEIGEVVKSEVSRICDTCLFQRLCRAFTRLTLL